LLFGASRAPPFASRRLPLARIIGDQPRGVPDPAHHFNPTITPPESLYLMTKYALTRLMLFSTGTGPHRRPSPGLQSDLGVSGRPPADWVAGRELGRVAASLDLGGTEDADMFRGVARDTGTRDAVQESCGVVEGAAVGYERQWTSSANAAPRRGCPTELSHRFSASTRHPRTNE